MDFINKIFFELFTLKKPFSYKTIRRYERKPFNLSTSGTSHSPACGILPLVETFTPHSSHFTYQKAAIGIIRDVGKACFSDTLLAGFAFAHSARMRKSAFTLAEVLITLGIIGVVASMTLPTLVNKYQKQETVARLSAAYSLVSQAIKRSEVDNEALDYWNFELDSQTFSDKYIKPYFQVIASYKAEDVPKNVHNYCMNGTNCDSYFDYFDLPNAAGNMDKFQKIDHYLTADLPHVKIGVVGKYFDVPDAYKSLNEALFHAGIQNNVHVDIVKINAEGFSPSDVSELDGILVPGGFGTRGVSGKIAAACYARENRVPYMGICLGMQVAVIEFARNVLGISDADSTEFAKNCTPVINIMPDHDAPDMGGTLRLGAYPCVITPGTLAHKIYGTDRISERHRHRYEMDIAYAEKFADAGMIISGRSPDGRLPEIVELNNHPFFIAGQFHPEFQSSPYTGHPMFNAFIAAARDTHCK